MSKMQVCGNCGNRYSVKHERCPECATHAASVTAPKERSADHLRCGWIADGKRCCYPGTMTSSVQADESTQWFCSLHFGCTDPVFGAQIVEASRDYVQAPPRLAKVQAEANAYCEERGLFSVAQMQAHSKQLLGGIGRRPGNLDWARRILERIAAGEKLPMISEQKARLALGVPSEREPGEEG